VLQALVLDSVVPATEGHPRSRLHLLAALANHARHVGAEQSVVPFTVGPCPVEMLFDVLDLGGENAADLLRLYSAVHGQTELVLENVQCTWPAGCVPGRPVLR
jgi:hypothetical protein